jgi:hypothetical protein
MTRPDRNEGCFKYFLCKGMLYDTRAPVGGGTEYAFELPQIYDTWDREPARDMAT